ncbi:MAG: alpha/beta hydrolase [Proteobacteria bacterium]|nr:alpha/beta hydrolase [Pseudomonadota bacterium]HQR05156.1 alpha/beta hydrolase [Rhodocyclaceae bacterium]
MNNRHIEHRQIDCGEVEIHAAIQGKGPVVLMVHGFPGLWYSWRHQLPLLADAGYRTVAIDTRGYGRSSRPADPARYDAECILNDLECVLDSLEVEKAILVGQDFGAQAVWNMALRRPHRVSAVVGCVPYDFDLAGRACGGSHPQAPDGTPDTTFASATLRPSEMFAAAARKHFYHMHYFQTIGPAERELGAQPALFLQRLFWALSARGHLLDWTRFPSAGTGYLDVLADPEIPLPWPWLSQADFDVYLKEYLRTGPGSAFIGGLNSYRVADRNWELGAPWADANVEQPALFLCGADDVVLQMLRPDWLDLMRTRVPRLAAPALIPGAGHFVQQEQPEAFNAALLGFLSGLPR